MHAPEKKEKPLITMHLYTSLHSFPSPSSLPYPVYKQHNLNTLPVYPLLSLSSSHTSPSLSTNCTFYIQSPPPPPSPLLPLPYPVNMDQHHEGISLARRVLLSLQIAVDEFRSVWDQRIKVPERKRGEGAVTNSHCTQH